MSRPLGDIPREPDNGAQSPECRDERTSPDQEEKRRRILEACGDDDLAKLRALAESCGGLLHDDLRRLAWPKFLGLTTPPPEDRTWKDLPAHIDEDQVQMDVKRSFIYYPNDESQSELTRHKNELADLITAVLRQNPDLCYFQGYHDICQVFVLVLEPAWRLPLVSRLSLLRIRDFMLPSLAPTVAQLKLLPDILEQADGRLRHHLANLEPFYALAGTLTMYAHNIQGYGDIARLFDALLAREPVFSIYLFAQMVLDRRGELFETPADDTAMLHFILSKLPPKLDLDRLIPDSVALFESHRPESLRSWRTLSRYSVSRTASSLQECSRQSLEDGRRYFRMHAREIRWAELRKRALRPLGAHGRILRVVGMAVAVGVLAYYVRRGPASLLGREIWRFVAW